MSGEWENDKNELLKIFNVESPVIPEDSGILMNFLIDKNIFITIDEPKNKREFVNLYATVISTLKSKGQNLVPKQYKDKIYTLSFQLGIPLVDVEDY